MTDKERLFEAFGELLYVIAMADGLIQEEEVTALKAIIKDHEMAAEIKWSFDYEMAKKSDPEEVYKKVIDVCHHYGPSPIYADFKRAITTIANASDGIDGAEQEKINSFSRDLVARFQRDLEERN